MAFRCCFALVLGHLACVEEPKARVREVFGGGGAGHLTPAHVALLRQLPLGAQRVERGEQLHHGRVDA